MALSADKKELMILMIDSCSKEDLNEIIPAINDRYKTLRRREAQAVMRKISVGDKVKIGNVRTQYLQGRTGVIEEIRSTRVTVKLDCGPLRKFRNGRVIISPAALTLVD